MAIKTASPELRSRINKAASMIGRGINLQRPEVELEGRHQSALAHIENQILLGRHLLSAAERRKLSEMLLVLDDTDTADDYTADATETNAEALQPTPDAEGEYEDPEDEIA